ncbi:uncharacterized protein VTP21DRAFT_8234 [Calcarisporiella thermophila]|uniref:uncharacterized protein n=1 Tax=Calcarisporiella thermophila TaxID=911321 RepID=UPI003743884E
MKKDARYESPEESCTLVPKKRPWLDLVLNPCESTLSKSTTTKLESNDKSQGAKSREGMSMDEQISTVVEILAGILRLTKEDVEYRLPQLEMNDVRNNPSPILAEINSLLDGSDAKLISSLHHLRQCLAETTSPSYSAYARAINFYALMTAFITVCQCFFEVLVWELSASSENDTAFIMGDRNHVLRKFLTAFHNEDNFLAETGRQGGMDAFLWHYHLVTCPNSPRQKLSGGSNMTDRLIADLQAKSIRFVSLDAIESIYSTFYTQYFLNAVATQHQKDHGQFYTPRGVIRFMWDRCLHDRDESTLLQRILDVKDSNDGNKMEVDGFIPRVLDPCMGTGGFLAEYINRLTTAASHHPKIWNSPTHIQTLIRAICANLWGIEIDSFALHFCRINIMAHLLPLYWRSIRLSGSWPDIYQLPRLKLFCNDTMRLHVGEDDDRWEAHEMHTLREIIQFDFVVTNPPYMIRKTGYLAAPDNKLYDERVLGARGTQAYLYFLWFALQRLVPETGVVCLITASQWLGLEFADKLRLWLWNNCYLEEFYQFEPYRVWRKVQTDSLIFRIRRRATPLNVPSSPIPYPAAPTNGKENGTHESPRDIIFLRHVNKRSTLEETLDAYARFDPRCPSASNVDFRITPATNFAPPTSNASFTFLMPTTAVSEELATLVSHLPGLCDPNGKVSGWSDERPLEWHRGPNTNPVYALVVRTAWAKETFGEECCKRWMRRVFYWNGKNSGVGEEPSSPAGGSGNGNGTKAVVISNPAVGSGKKEAKFWYCRDSLRLTKKESSPAESYLPFIDPVRGDYSLILVDKEGATRLKQEVGEEGPLWKYLREAREQLQSGMRDKEVAWCQFNNCGSDIPVKIVHPINYGYFSKSQPRQRFFLDVDSVCVTNQCIYFTVKPGHPPASFFLALLNSTSVQYFLTVHCRYDQQGRLRLFRESMARVPYAKPRGQLCIESMVDLAIGAREVRHLLFWIATGGSGDSEGVGKGFPVAEKIRRGIWEISKSEKTCLLDWWSKRIESARREKEPNGNSKNSGARGSGNESVIHHVETLLWIGAILQYAVDQHAYALYHINPGIQVALEQELGLEVSEKIIEQYPRFTPPSHTQGETNVIEETRVPSWGAELIKEMHNVLKEATRFFARCGFEANLRHS